MSYPHCPPLCPYYKHSAAVVDPLAAVAAVAAASMPGMHPCSTLKPLLTALMMDHPDFRLEQSCPYPCSYSCRLMLGLTMLHWDRFGTGGRWPSTMVVVSSQGCSLQFVIVATIGQVALVLRSHSASVVEATAIDVAAAAAAVVDMW